MSDQDGEDVSAMRSPVRIGFIGLGRMGYPMARNLAAQGYLVSAYDVRPEVRRKFSEQFGTTQVSDLAQLNTCNIIITMLPSSKEVEEVLLGVNGRGGLSSGLSRHTLVLDCSSSDPLVTRRLGAALAAKSIGMIDSPVAGGVVFAEDGTLDILVGGEPDDIAKAEPILLALGKKVHRCGRLGSAHAMKILNNFVNAQVLLTYTEAMAVGTKLGMSMDVLVGSLQSATTGRNHPFEKKFLQQVATGKFGSGMALGLIAKDVNLAHKLASEIDAWAPIMEMTADLWSEASKVIGPSSDQTEAVRLWESRNSVELRQLRPKQ